MKHNILYPVMLALLAVCTLGFTSCMDDDNDNEYTPLTASEQQAQQLLVAGYHKGYCAYMDTIVGQSVKSDTVDIAWTCNTDSMITVHNFPVGALGRFINNTDLKKAVEALPNEDITLQYYAENDTPLFLVTPLTITKTLNVGGTQKEVKLVFYAGNIYNPYNWMQYVNVGSTINSKLRLQFLFMVPYMDGVAESVSATQTFILTQE